MSLPPQMTGSSQNSASSPKLPLEILYRVVSEIYAAHHPGSGNPWKAVSQTCHTMAAYCRPLTFRSVILHTSESPRARPPPLSPSTFLRGNIKQFAEILARDPSIVSFMVHLDIDLTIPLPLERLTPEQMLERFHEQDWLLLFEKHAPRLKVLKLKVDNAHHLKTMFGSFLGFLAQSRSLQSFTLEHTGLIGMPIIPFDFVPPSVKYMTIDVLVGLRPHYGQGFPEASKRTVLPKLDSLSIVSGSITTSLYKDSNYGQILPFDLTNLKHLQLELTNLLQIKFCRALTLPSAHTLQCLHLRIPSQEQVGIITPPRHLDAPHFPNLRCLEIWAPWPWRRHLHIILTWVSDLLDHLESSTTVQKLKVSLIAPTYGYHDEPLLERIAFWEEACQQDLWPSLKKVCVVSYAALEPSAFPKVGLEKVVPLGAYGGGEVGEYHSLWEGGPCSGWRTG
jgi:hypothetical protein